MDKALIEAVCQAMPEAAPTYWKDRERIAEAVIPVVLEAARAAVKSERLEDPQMGTDDDSYERALDHADEAIRNLGASQ